MSGRTPTRSKGDSNRASSVKKSSSPGTLHKGKRPISQEGTPANHPSKLSPREDRAEKRAKSASAIKADTSTPVTGVLQASGSVSTKRALLQSQKRRPDGVASAVPKRLLANMGTPKQQQQQQTPNNSGLKPPTSSGRGSAPPTTVAEAQELGEQARLHDETMWALEGLTSGSVTAQQESLAALADLYANRRNRIALHSSSMGADVLRDLASVAVQKDTTVAMGAACLLLMVGQATGDPLVFSRPSIANLVAAVLENTGSFAPRSTMPAPAVRILRVLHDPSLSRILPREASFSPQSVMLAALSDALDPHGSSTDIEPLKSALRGGGVLRAVAQVAAQQTRTLSDPSPTMETVQGLWKLQRCLMVLEHSCFACAENEAHLVEMEVTHGLPPVVNCVLLIQWLVQQVQVLNRQAFVPGLKKDCLRGLLAVLMNMTQNNADGCIRVVSVGGMEAVTHTLVKIAIGGPQMKGALNNSNDLTAWVDEVSGCLGLLINLVEHSVELRERMRAVAIPKGDGSDEEMQLVPLLSRLMSSAMTSGSGSNGDAVDGGPPKAEEVTLDTLRHGEGEAIGSIVEVYAAILLGFLVEGDQTAQVEAAALLPGGTLKSVVAAVQRCLQFYVTAGALTQHTENSLRALLASLQKSA